MYCQKYGAKLGKPVRIENTRMEKRDAKTRQCSTRLRGGIYFMNPDDEEYKETFQKMRGESWKGRWQQPCRARRRFIVAPGNW